LAKKASIKKQFRPEEAQMGVKQAKTSLKRDKIKPESQKKTFWRARIVFRNWPASTKAM
jgi:hypothetical protein